MPHSKTLPFWQCIWSKSFFPAWAIAAASAPHTHTTTATSATDRKSRLHRADVAPSSFFFGNSKFFFFFFVFIVQLQSFLIPIQYHDSISPPKKSGNRCQCCKQLNCVHVLLTGTPRVLSNASLVGRVTVFD